MKRLLHDLALQKKSFCIDPLYHKFTIDLLLFYLTIQNTILIAIYKIDNKPFGSQGPRKVKLSSSQILTLCESA